MTITQADNIRELATPHSSPALARTYHLAPGHWAGHMRITSRICTSLAEAGYTVDLAAHPSGVEQIDPRVRLYSLGDYGRPTLSWRLGERLQRSRQAYKLALRSGADMFAFYAPEFISWGVRLRRATGKPVIFDCMEDFEGYALQRRGIPAALRRPLAMFTRIQLRHAARNLDAIVVSDAGTGALLRPFARRVEVVHNFPQLEHFPDPGERPDEQRPFDLTYHGSIPRYHLEMIFAIDDVLVARGRRLRWRFLGRMAEEAWFRAEVARRDAAARIIFSGQVPHEHVAAEVVQARIGIIPLPGLPKFQHNIPQKLFEFMALRMPVVLSDLPPSRPFVGDARCALMVDPADPSAYASAIEQLLDNPQLRRQMGAEGRRRVEREYSWEQESQKLLSLYAELLPAQIQKFINQ